jgi:GNAT superfamily N-acetyltransferase
VFTITAAEPKDVDDIAALLDEQDRFYGDPGGAPREVRITKVRDALFSDVPAGYALLVWDGPDLIGMANYSFLWPAADAARSMYLKELFVAEPHRRQGIGKQLMDALLDVATKHGCTRLEWTTDEENEDAQRFYEELGYSRSPKIFYRVGVELSAGHITG